MKALDDYFLLVVFTLLLNSGHVFLIFMFSLDRESWQWKGDERYLGDAVLVYRSELATQTFSYYILDIQVVYMILTYPLSVFMERCGIL